MSDSESITEKEQKLIQGKPLSLPEGYELRATAEGVSIRVVDYHARKLVLSWRLLTLLLATRGLPALAPKQEQ